MKNTVVVHDADSRQWLHFHDIQQLIVAETVEAVAPALRTVEKIVTEKGWYAAGFISYEASPAFDSSFQVLPHSSFPLLWFGLYTAPDIITLPDLHPMPPDFPSGWTPSIDVKTYDDAICQIKNSIAGGETYQVNFTYRLHASFTADPWSYFLRIARAQRADYAAYVDTGRFAVCCASPELFFRRDGRTITARPMKGTANRGVTNSEDKARAEWLFHSEKNRAENIMIVDMIRNDLGRIAITGSVEAPRLFDIERYPTVWQMTSTVTAQSDGTAGDILHALFPCSSITGAPKSHTTEIIARLESSPRNIYTGCIGYIAPDRKAQFNVAIRTVLVDRETERAEYGVGGGIVWDSSSSEEYEECRIKARILREDPVEFSLLETLLYTPEEKYFLLDYHLRRLLDSAEYFGIPVKIEQVMENLRELERSFSDGTQKVRLFVSASGDVSVESVLFDASDPVRPVRLGLASKAVDSSDRFLYHKTTNRTVYESADTAADCDDILLWNERGEITETTIANVVFRRDGELVTPPASCGLLPGTFRAWLLDRKIIRERKILVEEIQGDEEVYVINSLRKKREAEVRLR